ncbi:MAG: type 1 glutamine amidotransferase [Pseudomonadota bacterium]
MPENDIPSSSQPEKPASPASERRATDEHGPAVARVPDRRQGRAEPADGDALPRYHREHDTAIGLAWRVLTSRWRALRDKAGRDFMRRTLRIGVSARIFHPEPGSTGLRSKNLQYLEESIAQWVMSRDVLVFMVPTVNTNGLLHPSNITLRHYARHLDGLVLQGGADVSPQTYAQEPTRPEWSGDRARDLYELELLHEFIDAGKPVLGICRGCQLINVAFGGTLYQDVASNVPEAIEHVNSDYDAHRHAVAFPKGSMLGRMYPKLPGAVVNSIHHQAVKDLGRDITVEAWSEPDGIIEAIRYQRADFVMGLQWHPEFHSAGGVDLLDCTPILDEFLRSARETRF